MNSTRVMDGLTDLTGQTCGTFKVERMVTRRPEPRYAVTCTKCGVGATATQTRLRNGAAVCQYSGCGKTQKSRSGDLLTEQRRQIAERENQRLADEQAASEARMNAESEGWERPTKYVPTPDPKPAMSAREVAARKERREAEEAAERERLRPIREAERLAAAKREEAESANQERVERQRRYWAQWVLEDRDPKLFVSPALVNASMSKRDAAAFNLAAVEKFNESVPDYAAYQSPENADILVSYFARNGITIYDAEMLKAAFLRLRDLGILTKNPVETSTPPEDSREVSEVTPRSQEPSGPKVYRGRDYATGLVRDFTEREIARLTADEYRRAFAIAPTVYELFTQMGEMR